MFRWAIIFAVIALIASFLGFGGVAGLSSNLAYIFLVVAVILFIVAFVGRKMQYCNAKLRLTEHSKSKPIEPKNHKKCPQLRTFFCLVV